MRKTRRTLRIGDEIRSALSQIFLRDMTDPQFRSLTVIDVEVAPDLRFARVWLSTLDEGEKREAALDLLERSKGRIRRLLAERARMRHTPDLAFSLDETSERAMKIEAILREVLPEAGSDDDEESEP